MLNQQRRWLRLLAWLRREFPAQKPVTVRSVKMHKDMCGEASYDGRVFRILINRDKPKEVVFETAIHEWAHVLTWFGAGHEEEHPDEWGLCYAKIYNAYDNWNPPKMV